MTNISQENVLKLN